MLWLLRPDSPNLHQCYDLDTKLDLYRITKGFHEASVTGVACQTGMLTLWTPGSVPPFWDLLMLQLLRPVFLNFPCLFSTFHFEYTSVLSRFCFKLFWSINTSFSSSVVVRHTIEWWTWYGLTLKLVHTQLFGEFCLNTVVTLYFCILS